MSDILSRTSWRTSRLPACSWSDRGRARDHAGVQRVRDDGLLMLADRRRHGDEQQLPTRVCDKYWRPFMWAMINETPGDALSPAKDVLLCACAALSLPPLGTVTGAPFAAHMNVRPELAPFHVGNTVSRTVVCSHRSLLLTRTLTQPHSARACLASSALIHLLPSVSGPPI